MKKVEEKDKFGEGMVDPVEKEQMQTFKETIEAESKDKDAEEKEEKEKEPKHRTMESFLGDKEEQANARKLGISVQELVSSNWFDMKRYCKKTRRGGSEAYLQLNILKEFGHLAVKMVGKTQYYKVDFTYDDQIALLESEIKEMEFKIKIKKVSVKDLKKRKADQKKKSPRKKKQ